MHALNGKDVAMDCPHYIQAYKSTLIQLCRKPKKEVRLQIIRFIDKHEYLVGGDFR